MPKGTIRRLMSGRYGFIITEDGTNYFFHGRSLDGVEFDSLSEGQEVEFEMSQGQGRDNRPAAVKVKLVEVEAETQADDSGDDKGGESGG